MLEDNYAIIQLWLCQLTLFSMAFLQISSNLGGGMKRGGSMSSKCLTICEIHQDSLVCI